MAWKRKKSKTYHVMLQVVLPEVKDSQTSLGLGPGNLPTPNPEASLYSSLPLQCCLAFCSNNLSRKQEHEVCASHQLWIQQNSCRPSHFLLHEVSHTEEPSFCLLEGVKKVLRDELKLHILVQSVRSSSSVPRQASLSYFDILEMVYRQAPVSLPALTAFFSPL